MILSVRSTLPTFKALTFRSGLNVLLSTRAQGSNEKKTRNSAGKTSFVELIHFLLGADCDADDLFRKPELVEQTFEGTFRIAGREVTVARSGSVPSRVLVDPATAEVLGLATKPNRNGAATVSNSDWVEYLGHTMFGLPASLKGSPYGESFTPKFRPLVSYFARRDGSGGYISPERQAEKQQRWDWQVNLSYLLGLDWRLSRELHQVRQRERALKELAKAAKGGTLDNLIGTAGKLRPQAVTARDKATKLRERLERFEVVDSFRELAAEAARAKAEMQQIARRAVSLREAVAFLRHAIQGESAAPLVDVTSLYEAVGVELPGAKVRRRFEQVADFQNSVLANRRAHLQGEITRAEEELAGGERRSEELDRERSRILRILQSGGALDDFIDLQRLLAEADAEAALLGERLKAAEALARETTQLDIDRGSIKLRLIENLRTEDSDIDQAILQVGQAIAELYDDRTGKFEIEATDNGPEFRITIQGDEGSGISKMEIFCLDLALFTIWLGKSKGPGFLLHDSHLYDGVDSRQTLKAIELGGAIANLFDQQYIICLNSDVLEKLSIETDIEWDTAILKPVLSDREDGGLFGFQFN